MTQPEFDEWLARQTYEDRIVSIRYKYKFEKEWSYSNELLLCTGSGNYAWYNDWNEGQENVEILGCLSIAEVLIPTFKEHEDLKDYACKKLATEIAKIMFGGDR